MFKPKPLTVDIVFDTLKQIAKTSGTAVRLAASSLALTETVASQEDWTHLQALLVVRGDRNQVHHPLARGQAPNRFGGANGSCLDCRHGADGSLGPRLAGARDRPY